MTLPRKMWSSRKYVAIGKKEVFTIVKSKLAPPVIRKWDCFFSTNSRDGGSWWRSFRRSRFVGL